MDHEHGSVCQPMLEHQIRLCTPSSVTPRPTCFNGSLRCCWQVGSAPFVRRRCDCLADSAPFTNIQTYLLTYRLFGWLVLNGTFSTNRLYRTVSAQEINPITISHGRTIFLQCFDAVGWATGRASGL